MFSTCLFYFSRASVTCICNGISLSSVLLGFYPQGWVSTGQCCQSLSSYKGRKVWLAVIWSDHSGVVFIHTIGKNKHHWIQWHSGILMIKHCLGALEKKQGGERLLYQQGGRGSPCCSIFTLAEYFTQVFYERFGLTCFKGSIMLTKTGTWQLQMLS